MSSVPSLSRFSGELASDCNGSCTSGAVRGQKLRASKGFRLSQKLKQKKFQRWRFLDFNIKFKKPRIFYYKIT
jgi:hypothetical protein